MIVGVPTEIKNREYRVGLTPAGVRELRSHGHTVLVQQGAGNGAGYEDAAYEQVGASLVSGAAEVFERADMIVKVKEPQPVECRMLRPGQLLFAYLHLAPDPEQTKLLLASGASAIAYEAVTDAQGGLPLLAPMSEVAGRLSIQQGACYLEKHHGGKGILLGGVPGVVPARVVVIGGGVVGLSAARVAMGMGADVTLLDRSLPRLRHLDDLYGDRLRTLYSSIETLEQQLERADLVVGAILIPGAAAPKLVSRAMLKRMQPGTVMVDVAIDQGGCFETSRPTSHENPVFEVEGIVHYCVTNMPGAVPRTSTQALTHATLPFVIALANKGLHKALADDAHLREGLNIHAGKLTYAPVANALEMPLVSASEALKG
ncbi:MAG: alanine dehydrogenase [Pseudomonadales bacterium]|nr:alanine dehydrogenase [Pseudomonadales bacterium]MCP5356958.1 alanine dehydrogenase [Pseudomonadales bacterium]